MTTVFSKYIAKCTEIHELVESSLLHNSCGLTGRGNFELYVTDQVTNGVAQWRKVGGGHKFFSQKVKSKKKKKKKGHKGVA